MSVSVRVTAACDQCGKTREKKAVRSGFLGSYEARWTPQGWLNLFSQLFCGWKCVSDYALAQLAAKKKPVAKKKKPVAKKKR